jgi:hypothetical protein
MNKYKNSLDDRICRVCNQYIPEGGHGVYWASFRWLVHAQGCNRNLESIYKDRSKTKRGRYRSKKELEKLLSHPLFASVPNMMIMPFGRN